MSLLVWRMNKKKLFLLLLFRLKPSRACQMCDILQFFFQKKKYIFLFIIHEIKGKEKKSCRIKSETKR